MADVEDVVEAVVDIEDLVEEVADPEELVEDFLEQPAVVALALAAGIAGAVALLLFLLTVALLVLAVGPVRILAAITVLSFLTMALAVGGFLYVRTDIPSHVQRKIDAALERADGGSAGDGAMTEEEAIAAIRAEYAAGNIDDYELESALEETLTSEDPERVVERYS